MDHVDYLQRAVELSREKMHECQGGPFGAVVVKDGRIIGEGWNCVTHENDPTAHAEINAIRRACRQQGSFSLEGATIYTSCEPCPMCLAAIYWARISRVFYANTSADAAAIGFDDQLLHAELARPAEKRSLPSVQLHVDGARDVFVEWADMPGRIEY